MIYVDSNALIYAATDAGPMGRAAVSALKAAFAQGAATASLTIDEFLRVVRKRVGRAAAAEKGRQLLALDLDVAPVTAQDAKVAVSLFEGGMDPRDAIHTAVARRVGCAKILSSDPAFDEVEGLLRVAY